MHNNYGALRCNNNICGLLCNLKIIYFGRAPMIKIVFLRLCVFGKSYRINGKERTSTTAAMEMTRKWWTGSCDILVWLPHPFAYRGMVWEHRYTNVFCRSYSCGG